MILPFVVTLRPTTHGEEPSMTRWLIDSASPWSESIVSITVPRILRALLACLSRPYCKNGRALIAQGRAPRAPFQPGIMILASFSSSTSPIPAYGAPSSTSTRFELISRSWFASMAIWNVTVCLDLLCSGGGERSVLIAVLGALLPLSA